MLAGWRTVDVAVGSEVATISLGTEVAGVIAGDNGGACSAASCEFIAGVGALVDTRAVGLVGWLTAATGTTEGGAELRWRIKNSPAPRMRNTAAPAMIKGVFPRDSLTKGSEVVWDDVNLPKTSLEVAAFRVRAGSSSQVGESDVVSMAGSTALTGEWGLAPSTVWCVDSSDFLETGIRGVGSGALLRATAGGDICISPAMSSNDGAFPAGATVSGTVGATRGGVDGAMFGTIGGAMGDAMGGAMDDAMGGATGSAMEGTMGGALGGTMNGILDGTMNGILDGTMGGSPGTTCGCVATGGGATPTAGGAKTFDCPSGLWMPQKSAIGSRNSTSI